MSEQLGIYWIQGLVGSVWQNLQRCANLDDSIARMGLLLTDENFSELRLVLAQSQDGHIEYTTLVTTRDGAVISDSLLDAGLPPTAPPRPAGWKLRAVVLCAILVAAIAGGLAIANYDRHLAIAFYERASSLVRPDQPKPGLATQTSAPPKSQTTAPPAVQIFNPPAAKPSLTRTEPSYADRLFTAVDADDKTMMRLLMAARPGDLQLDEVREFVDDGWGAGPRMIVDYALLGGNLAAADALLSAGATPSDWLLGVIARNTDFAKLQRAISLLREFGAVPDISVEAAIEETNRELSGN